MKSLFSIILLCFTMTIVGQNKTYDFNLDFENISHENQLPTNWNKMGKGYNISIDNTIVHRGKNSIMISPEGRNRMLALSNTIPLSYDGKEIEFKLYTKSEDVSAGEVVMALSADNLYQNFVPLPISGTTDWTEYTITIPYSKEAKSINISLMARETNGKIWLDDGQLLVDGKDIRDMEPAISITFKADEDKEFDNGSGIGQITLDSKKTDNLITLGLIWGFLKYYHPNIAAGNFNWDYELFRYLMPILNSKTKEERDSVFILWINSLGTFETSDAVNSDDTNVKQIPDFSWIENSNLDKKLVELLLKIKDSARGDYNYYIKPAPFVGNALFDNEREYNKMDYNDTGYRLLALYRYWNIIEYFNPNKHLIEENWKDILTQFIPQFINTSNELDYKLAVAALVARVKDSHAMLKEHSGEALNSYWGSRFAPISIQFIENKAVVTKNLNKSSILKAGDIITSINGKKTEDIISEKSKYLSASNKSHLLYNLATNVLTRTREQTISIAYSRDNIQNQETMKTHTRDELPSDSQPDSCFRFINNNIAYLYAGNYQSSLLPEFMEKAKHTKGLIVDLRCYPSDELIYSLTKYLIAEPTGFAKFSMVDITRPGVFRLTDPIKTGENNPDPYKGKVIILVNEKTISQGEFTAMALKTAPNAIVVGSQTGGADGNISLISIPGGLKTCISGIGVYYPDGQETQRVGIIPDIIMSPTIEGIAKGKDEILEKAISIIE